MIITDKNRDLVLALQENPLASYVEISRTMKITPATAKKRLESLWSKESKEPIVIRVSGNLNPLNIDLVTSTFIIEVENHMGSDNLKKFYEICEYHPYTSYQNRMYGSINGFLVQFTSPKGSESLLHDMFNKLSDDLRISRIEQFSQPSLKFNTYPNINALQNGKWVFDFNNWYSKSIENTHEGEISLENQPSYDINKLEKNHLIIARELTMNARRKQSEIMNDIQKSNQYNDYEKMGFTENNQREVSRYFDFVNQNNIIENYQLMFNRERFGLFNMVCFFGKMNNGNRNEFISALRSPTEKIPFRTRVSFNKNNYFIFMDLPPTQSLQAMNFIYDHSTEMNMMVMETSLKHQRNYPIWHRNYIDKTSGWKWNDSREWMIDMTINEVMN